VLRFRLRYTLGYTLCSNAARAAFCLPVTPSGFRQNTQRIVHRLGGRKHFGHIAVQHDDVRSLGKPRQVFAADAGRKIVLRSHHVTIRLFVSQIVTSVEKPLAREADPLVYR